MLGEDRWAAGRIIDSPESVIVNSSWDAVLIQLSTLHGTSQPVRGD